MDVQVEEAEGVRRRMRRTRYLALVGEEPKSADVSPIRSTSHKATPSRVDPRFSVRKVLKGTDLREDEDGLEYLDVEEEILPFVTSYGRRMAGRGVVSFTLKKVDQNAPEPSLAKARANYTLEVAGLLRGCAEEPPLERYSRLIAEREQRKKLEAAMPRASGSRLATPLLCPHGKRAHLCYVCSRGEASVTPIFSPAAARKKKGKVACSACGLMYWEITGRSVCNDCHIRGKK